MFVWLMIAATALLMAGAPDMHSAPAAQWPFDPSGHFYPKEKLPGQFVDFDHVTLLGSTEDAANRPRPGVYTTQGEVYTFTTLHTNATLDFRKILFEFTTTTINGTRYEFTGEFLNNHVFEEYVTDPNEVVAQGRLLRLKNSGIEAEAQVQFVYSAKPRTLRAAVNVKYPSGKTDLIYAVANGDTARVRELIATGTQVNARGPNGATALEYAVQRFKGQEVMVEALIAAGADVNLANESGETALMFAGYAGVKVVELLLAAGAEANAQAKDGRTPLIHAAQAVGARLGSLEIVKALIRAKADLNAHDKFGRTALSIAEEDRDSGLSNLLKQAGAKK
jgi:ankyrin repeat protein